jgi:protocatechuate 3,4-dioxygenase beta subunit
MRRLLAGLLLALTACTSVATKVAPTPTPSAQPDVAQVSPSPAATAAATCPPAATPAVTEGPYFKAGSPERTSLVDSGVVGTRLTLTGHVYGTGCAPIARAVLDFWQADGNGQYDNSGYRLRGHQQTAVDGTFVLDTVVPGLYPGRTEHIHVKVAAPGKATLTTQLFFPNSTTNLQDSIYRPELLVKLSGPANALSASYDFLIG